MKTLHILPGTHSVDSIQKLVVPERLNKLFSAHFNKCVLVKRTDQQFTINLVYPRLNLNSEYCMHDDSVIYSELSVNNFPIYDESHVCPEITEDQIIPLTNTQQTTKVTVSVILENIFQLAEWKSKQTQFTPIIINILRLFIFSANSTILLRNLNLPLGIHSIIIHDTDYEAKIPCFLSSNCNVSIHKLISRTTYLQLVQNPERIIVGGLLSQVESVKKIIEAQKNYRQKWSTQSNLKLSKQILLIGASGSGKTTLVQNLAQATRSTIVILDGSEVMNASPGESENFLRSKFQEAELLLEENESGVCILLIKQVECLARKRKSETPAHSLRCMSQLLSLLDSANNVPGLLIIATTDKVFELDSALRRSGRLETELYFGIPSEKDRAAILSIYLEQLNLQDVPLISNKIAAITPGYLGVDIVLIVKTFHLRTASIQDSLSAEKVIDILTDIVSKHQASALKSGLGVVSTEPLPMSELGGLDSIKKTLKIYLEWPLLYPEKFQKLNIPPPKGILLYGPPGCAKTSLARALASSTKMTFFSVSAAELYSPFVGATEKSIVELFHRARIGAPSIVFIDEIDALVGKRGDKNEGVHERVLSTFLTEMDGVGTRLDSLPLKLTDDQVVSSPGVVIMAATNRPDKLDAAILRPGRLNKLIYVPPPDEASRLKILEAVTKKVPLSTDVNLALIANITELFSGADLINLVREAGLTALTADGMTVSELTQAHFLTALKNARPSLSADQIKFYTNFTFNQ
nr:PREDICTED: spermatogenesis-associated protein 5-like protein 1 [Bemisia tabaci]